MSENRALVWFGSDLRLADNPALTAAIARRFAVLPVFIWAPDEESPWPPGAASRWWLHQSLLELDATLTKRRSRLIVRSGPTAEALLALAAESGAKSVFWNRRYEPAAISRDAAIERRLRERGVTPEIFPGNVLFEPGAVLNAQGKPYQVFTAFWRAMSAPPEPAPAPKKLPAPGEWPSSLPVAALRLEPAVDWAGGLRDTWRPGEAGAASRLRVFLKDAVEVYSIERDRPGHTGTSRLSPHLHFGEISARQIWRAAKMQDHSESYLRQIAWREFSYHLLYHFPHTQQQPLRPQFRFFPWKMDAQRFKAWTRGKTGYPIVDAGMRELWRTGWMHNRVRMLAASFLVKQLMIPWQEGAAWFWDTLVDADLANNTMGWQWVAGCGADAAPYFRIFNPVLQGRKFDPDGDYVRRWVPELAGVPGAGIHQPRNVSGYPPPIVEHDVARKRALAAFAAMRDLTGRTAST